MTSAEDVALALYVVGLLAAATFGALGETALALGVLLLVLFGGAASLALRARRAAATAAAPAADSRRLRRIVALRDEAAWLKLGVVGAGAVAAHQAAHAGELLDRLLGDLGATAPKKLCVVAGWRAAGVALEAHRAARRAGLPCVGFAARSVRDAPEPRFDCDEVFLVGRRPGDELEAFVSFVDGLVLIGGGAAERRLFDAFAGAKWRFELPRVSELPPPGDVVAPTDALAKKR